MAIEIPLSKLAEHVGASMSQTARAIKIAIFQGVIRDTRVDTGRLRGNWQTSTGQMETSIIERDDSTPQGVIGGSAHDEMIGKVKGNTIDYVTNNLPYAEHWEERDGMVAKNVARVDRAIKEALK